MKDVPSLFVPDAAEATHHLEEEEDVCNTVDETELKVNMKNTKRM